MFSSRCLRLPVPVRGGPLRAVGVDRGRIWPSAWTRPHASPEETAEGMRDQARRRAVVAAEAGPAGVVHGAGRGAVGRAGRAAPAHAREWLAVASRLSA